MVDLRECPFCGEQPKSYWQGASEVGDDGYWAIECCHVFVHTDEEEDAAHDWNLREPPAAEIDRLQAREKVLTEALETITDHYVRLAGSGDCGFWNPEEEDEVMLARAALARTGQEQP